MNSQPMTKREGLPTAHFAAAAAKPKKAALFADREGTKDRFKPAFGMKRGRR